MKTNIFLAVILIPLMIGGKSFAQLKVDAVKSDFKIDILINNSLFTSYIFSQDEKYPFFYPVNGPSKASVTSMRNGNYPHYSSLFFGCDKVNDGNYWQEGHDRGQIISLRADIIESDCSVGEWIQTLLLLMEEQ